jgi:hypothetical protein
VLGESGVLLVGGEEGAPWRHLLNVNLQPSYLATTTTTKSSAEMTTTMSPPPRLHGAPPDIIIECGGHTFRAHKDVVRSQSQKLQDACRASANVCELSIRIAHTNEADS